MNDSTNIHQAGVQINFRSWAIFNLSTLSCDGVVLFQYLVFHCQNNAEWTHSDNSLEKELGIKRTRLKTLRGLFESEPFGFLTSNIVSGRDGNQIRAYSIDFNKLASNNVLEELYRTHDERGEPVDLNLYAKIYKAAATRQPKKDARIGTKDRKQTIYQTRATYLAKELKATFDSRRTTFNNNRQPPSKRATGTINFSPKHLQKLANVLKHFEGDSEYIKDAFIAFCDTLNKSVVGAKSELLPQNELKSPLNYFLSYSNKARDDDGDIDPYEAGSIYAVIYSFGEYFAANYHVSSN